VLARAGATVLVTYRRSEAGARTVADGIAARGGRALVARADLGSRAACDALVAEARERLGGLDVWVNNAGADVLTGDVADWDWERKLDLLLAVDLKGTIACSYAAGAVMREQVGGGAIVNMSWDHVTSGMAGGNPELFSAVKGGVLAYSKSLARSLAPAVRVNVLCPGWIETAFGEQADPGFRRSVADSTPLRRWGTPADVAAAALYLSSPAAAFVTGQAFNVNGGTVM
jgi:3-oxoacyl-[acyl-carrier protein] reductase